ncbi:MerR family transcriptional regulator [Paramagnetospirillum magneticum]|uniref:Predicted transcriptional regulator n=1 Tax=Paramagnetospirillum magneticum (strain ATCC 700264 / AMB-1) TaxID=342108 RepID=Q2W057_PARM1|nr:MerR family transcriptional regulator [Paramagnetospirillum magneticum]BAE52768.1 Predicted transcriptional regulator [Paramagnetospirillum magneticum AMB-1]
MKIGDLAARSGLSHDTLRWYEKIGLLPRPPRSSSGHRDYDPAILAWIEFLGRLKVTGMPISQMLAYARLREQGEATLGERRQMLEAHRQVVRQRIADLQSSLAHLDAKIHHYATLETRHDPGP